MLFLETYLKQDSSSSLVVTPTSFTEVLSPSNFSIIGSILRSIFLIFLCVLTLHYGTFLQTDWNIAFRTENRSSCVCKLAVRTKYSPKPKFTVPTTTEFLFWFFQRKFQNAFTQPLAFYCEQFYHLCLKYAYFTVSGFRFLRI